MTQNTTHSTRGGWRQEEIDLLFSAVHQAAQTDRSLRDVFADVGAQLSRRPNSIRNFYYARVREEPELALRKSSFRTFTEAEVRTLLRNVLIGRGQGESVRACVTRLADGDRAGMLRYQNKYRSTLRGRPELIHEVMEELANEGLPCANPYASRGGESESAELLEQTQQRLSRTGDPALLKLLEGINALLDMALAQPKAVEAPDFGASALPCAGMNDDAFNRALLERDRLSARNDLLRIALDDEQNKLEALCAACGTLIEPIRDFLAQSELTRAQRLGEFCQTLALQLPAIEQSCALCSQSSSEKPVS